MTKNLDDEARQQAANIRRDIEAAEARERPSEDEIEACDRRRFVAILRASQDGAAELLAVERERDRLLAARRLHLEGVRDLRLFLRQIEGTGSLDEPGALADEEAALSERDRAAKEKWSVAARAARTAHARGDLEERDRFVAALAREQREIRKIDECRAWNEELLVYLYAGAICSGEAQS